MSGAHHTPESRARRAAHMRALWRDPAYRAEQAARLRRQAAEATAIYYDTGLLPEEGTALRWQYNKVRRILGARAARTIL